MKDLRSFQRFVVDAPTKVELLHTRRKRKIYESRLSELSATGAFFPSLRNLPVGQPVKVDIHFLFEGPGPSVEGYELVTMTVTGRIMRSDLSGTAVDFAGDYLLSSRIIRHGKVMARETSEYFPHQTLGSVIRKHEYGS